MSEHPDSQAQPQKVQAVEPRGQSHDGSTSEGLTGLGLLALIESIPTQGKVDSRSRRELASKILSDGFAVTASTEGSGGPVAPDESVLASGVVDALLISRLQTVASSGLALPMVLAYLGELIWKDSKGLAKTVKALGGKKPQLLAHVIEQGAQASLEDVQRISWLQAMLKTLEDQLLAAASEPSTSDEANAFVFTHFRGKLTNSAAAGEVFIPGARKSKLPYLFSATIQRDRRLPPDLISTASGASKIAALKGLIDVSPEVRAVAQRDFERHPAGEVGLDAIDARLRQVLIPKDGSYICLIPLSSAPLSEIVVNTVEAMEDRLSSRRAFEVNNGIGGSSVQNVTTCMGSIRKTWIFDVPDGASLSLRTAFAIAFKGFRLRRIRQSVLLSLAAKLGDGGPFKGDRDTVKSREIVWNLGFSAVSAEVKQQLLWAMRSVEEHRQSLRRMAEEDGLTVDGIAVDALAACILDGRMNAKAADLLSLQLIEKMAAARHGQKMVFNMTPALMSVLRTLSVEALSDVRLIG